MNKNNMDHLQGEILIVDDTPSHLRLLEVILASQGYTVRPALNGEFALANAKTEPPDLILLDIKMPKMSGYEVCEQLKADPRTREIPVIFISALQEVFDKVKAFSIGAVDYIPKPFESQEVLARVATHMGLRNLQKRLGEKNVELEQEITERKRAEEALHKLNNELEDRVETRTSQLQEANRALQETLDTLKRTQEQLVQSEKTALLISLVAGVAHEVNNPVGIGVTAASHLEQKTQELEALYQANQMKRSDLERYLSTATEVAGMILKNLHLAAERIQSFKNMAVDQASGEKRRFNLKRYIDDVLLSLRPKLKRTKHQVTIHCREDIEIKSYPGAFSQIISNLVLNSLQHGFEDQEQGEILLEIQQQDETLLITYSDNGKGMEEEYAAKIFDAFFTTKRDQGGSGLGMNIVHNLVTRKLQGQITCESTPGSGTTFTIQVPLEEMSLP